MKKVLIKGIGEPLGAAVARHLSADADLTIIGLGRRTPPGPVGRAEWLVADLSGQQLADLLRAEAVDVVIHLDFLGADTPAPNRETAVQQNVLGTMELLGACAAGGVRRVLIRSHGGVYGARPTNPTFINEGHALARGGLSGILRDLAEVEQFAAAFVRQRPELQVLCLRCAPLIGGESPLATYISQPAPRTLFGFDPIIQVLHSDDAARAFAMAAQSSLTGALNLAADDTLRLSQAIRMAGQQPMALFEPLVSLASALGDRSVLAHWPFDISFLRHSCIIDTSRAKQELGWAPTFSAAEAIQSLRAPDHSADRAAAAEALHAFLARRS